MIYALALGTNIDHAAALQQVHAALEQLGTCQYSAIYELPDRAGRAHLIYWNQAVLLGACQRVAVHRSVRAVRSAAPTQTPQPQPVPVDVQSVLYPRAWLLILG